MKGALKILLIIFTILVLWYLFLKPSDYTINFTSKSLPGTINQSIKFWGKGLKQSKDIDGLDLFNINQTFVYSDSIHKYHWTIKQLNDSLSKVSVDITDGNKLNSIINRLQIPFFKTSLALRSENTVYEFMKILKDHIENFKVTIVGEEETPGKLFAYVNLNKEQYSKAKGMMDNTNFISDVLLKNNMELDGFPIVEVLNWDVEKDSILFNFGFPIKKKDSLPDLGEIKFKELVPKKSLKAIYNGDYITSDRAWYQLLEYSIKNDIKVNPTPLEVFHNNPHMGGDALQWVTEVYMPIETTVSKN